METTTTETCDACGEQFDTLAEVFSHPCRGLPASTHTPHAVRRSDNIDRPESGNGQGGRYERLNNSNRYGGNCVRCGSYVPAGEGWLVKDNSAQRGGTVWGVEHRIGECSEQVEAQPRTNTISEKQEDYLRSLLARKNPEADADALVKALNDADNPRAAASVTIDALKQAPDAPKSAEAELEDGIYLVDGTVYKVYHTKHGANQQVAKELVIDGPANLDRASFEYRGKRPLRKIKPEHRMTLEQAKEFGAVYGVCCECSTTLTREESIEAGIGPVCARKFA